MNVSIGGIAKTVEITSFDKLGDVKVCMLTTTADGSVGFEQLNDEVRDTIYASFPVDTAEGDIASFEDGADNVPVREMKINVEPYQNLNGYDYPWVGGAGVNKLPYNSSGTGTITRSGITVAVNNGVFTISGTATAGDGINYPLVQSVDLSPSTNKIVFLNSVADGTITVAFKRGNTTVHFWTMTPVNRVATGWTDSGNEVIDTIAIQWTSSLSISGSIKVSPMLIALTETTPTAYIPYENICPIYPNNGKNLLPRATGRTVYGVTFTVNDDNSITLNGTPTAVGCDCYFVGDASSNYQLLNIPTGRYLLSGGIAHTVLYVVKEGGTIVAETNGSVTVDIDSSIKYRIFLRAIQGYTHSNAKVYPMLRPVEITDSAYVPYNAIGITRTGKNFFNKNDGLFGLWESGGQVYSSTNAYSAIVRCFPNTTYSISKIATSRFRISSVSQYPKDGVSGTSLNANDSATQLQVTTGNDAQYLLIYCYYAPSDGSIGMANVINSLQVEVGSSATQYEPYQGERYYSISDNPVYGGTLEVETGVLTVTRAYYAVNSSTTGDLLSQTNANRMALKMADGKHIGATERERLDITATGARANISPIAQATGYGLCCLYYPYGDQLAILLSAPKTCTTFAEARDWCIANNMAFCYPIEPQTYQLSPTQVKTLLGYNNIWTDSGTVEVQYLANIGLYIQKIIGATEDDMVANQNISANKYFFVGETLYYSTSAISAGQTIVVGTNCIKTNLADALNALNS